MVLGCDPEDGPVWFVETLVVAVQVAYVDKGLGWVLLQGLEDRHVGGAALAAQAQLLGQGFVGV